MGGCSSCVRKPVQVYQNILEECYNLLNQYNVQGIRQLQKRKYQKVATYYGQPQVKDYINQFQEITPSKREAADQSYNQFMSQDVVKLEGQVKLQAKTLSDHIQDTNIRLIDTIKYLKFQLQNYQTEYSGQWVTLLVLDVLVQNLKNYTQKHISLKQAQYEDSNMGSKLDNLTENNEGNNSTKEEKYPHQFQANIQTNNINSDKITFFSDNFIRFEIDFIEIALFILNEKINPFYAQSQKYFMNILNNFSQVHRDTYTSDKIHWLVDQLETDIINLTRQIIPENAEESDENLPQWENVDKKKVEALSILQYTYQSTLSKIKTQQNVFRTKQQQSFFFFTLRTILDFNKILRLQGNKLKIDNPLSQPIPAQENTYQSKVSSPNTIQTIIAEITSNCLGIISVFARRGFILKNYNSILSNLFKFFDKVKWDNSLLIENIINETISEARFESVQLNYKVYLLEQLIEYLQLGRPSQFGVPSIFFNSNLQQTNNLNSPNKPKSLNDIQEEIDPVSLSGKNDNQQKQKDEIQQGIKLENYTDPIVKIRAFKLFDSLVSQKDKEIPLLMHSTNKIVKCYLENLKDYNDIPEVKRSIQQSFVHYTIQLSPDSSALLTLLTSISSELCEFFNTTNLSKTQQVINTPKQSQQLNSVHLQNSLHQGQRKSFTDVNNYNATNNQLLNVQQSNDNQIKYITEGLDLMLLSLDSSCYFNSFHMISDEVIINLIFIGNLKSVQLNVFEVISKLILLKMKPDPIQDNPSIFQSLNQQMSGANTITNIKSSYDGSNVHLQNGVSQNGQSNIYNNGSSKFGNSENQTNSTYSIKQQMLQQISQNSFLHILHQSLKCVFNMNMNTDSNAVCNTVVIYQYTLQIVQEILKRNNVFQIRSFIAYLIKLIEEIMNYQQHRDSMQVGQSNQGLINSQPDPAQFNSTNNQIVLQSLQKNMQQLSNSQNINGQFQQNSINKQPTTFCLTYIAIVQLLQLLEQHMLSINSPAESIYEIISKLKSKEILELTKLYMQVFSHHQELTMLHKQRNYQMENSKASPTQKNQQAKTSIPTIPLASNDEIYSQQNELRQKINKLCNQIYEYQYIPNDAFNNNILLENIQKLAKSSGYYPEQSFDQMTAQFAKNFTSAVNNIDFNNFILDDEQSLMASKHSRNSVYGNFIRSNTNESLGNIEKEDEQFGNILNMIQTRNPNITNLFNGQNKDLNNDNKENTDLNIQDKNYYENKQNVLMSHNQSNQNKLSNTIDQADIQLKIL